MLDYLIISSRMLGNQTTVVKVKSDNWKDALYYFYEYVGGTVSKEIFKAAINGCETISKESMLFFKQITDESILYFGIINEVNSFIDEINYIN